MAEILRQPPQVIILAMTAVAAPNTGDTNENTLATITIPAGAMGLNGALRVTSVWSATNNANSKTIRLRLGGIGGTAFLAANIANAASARDTDRLVQNRGAANSQVSYAAASVAATTSSATTTGTIDTSVSTTLLITAQLGSAGDTVTLEGYTVELLRP